jgi:hypothetical protein
LNAFSRNLGPLLLFDQNAQFKRHLIFSGIFDCQPHVPAGQGQGFDLPSRQYVFVCCSYDAVQICFQFFFQRSNLMGCHDMASSIPGLFQQRTRIRFCPGTGFEMSAGQYPVFLFSGLFSIFAEVVALVFLLDLTRIPADTFQLFVALDVSTGRFGQLLAGVHTFALALLIAGTATSLLQIQRAAMIRYLLITGR